MIFLLNPGWRPGPARGPRQGGRGAAAELHPPRPRPDHALRGRHAGGHAAHPGPGQHPVTA